jgi:hypothetical protein
MECIYYTNIIIFTINMNDTPYINSYVENTKNTCFYIICSMFLIFLFIFGPLNRFIITSVMGRFIIICVLSYAIYQNTISAMNFSKFTNTVFTDGPWNTIKTNIICSYVFSLFILFLILKIISGSFQQTINQPI